MSLLRNNGTTKILRYIPTGTPQSWWKFNPLTSACKRDNHTFWKGLRQTKE